MITKENLTNLLEYVDFLRKTNEETEDYETCQELRDFYTIIGKHILGYYSYEDIEQTLFDFLLADANIKIEINNGTAIIQLIPIGVYFYFLDLSTDDVIRLSFIKNTQ
jgi:hypothetical protein